MLKICVLYFQASKDSKDPTMMRRILSNFQLATTFTKQDLLFIEFLQQLTLVYDVAFGTFEQDLNDWMMKSYRVFSNFYLVVRNLEHKSVQELLDAFNRFLDEKASRNEVYFHMKGLLLLCLIEKNKDFEMRILTEPSTQFKNIIGKSGDFMKKLIAGVQKSKIEKPLPVDKLFGILEITDYQKSYGQEEKQSTQLV